MSGDLYIATSGAMARLRDLEIVANNLANADTAGFKRDAAIFEAALEAALRDQDGEAVAGAAGSAYVGAETVSTDFSAGPVTRTGAALDVAIRGPGFFQVETPEGPRYTRAGSFAVDAGGQLTTLDGYPVSGDSGALQVGSRSAEITAGGEVVDASGEVFGRIAVFEFERREDLQKIGSSLFRAPDEAAALPVADVELAPRSLERSNVVPVKELAALMILQRAFDINMQFIRTDESAIDQLLREFQ